MSAEWAASEEQPILPTSTNFCITIAAGTQRVNRVQSLYKSLELKDTSENTYPQLKAFPNKCVLSATLKASVVSQSRTFQGKSFHNLGAHTEYALSPLLFSLDLLS
jgi:hypothetical protein